MPANQQVISAALAEVDAKKFEHLASVIAQARARWVATGIAATGESGRPPSAEQIAELSHLRATYEELAEVYEAMRRLMVERGYLRYAGESSRQGAAEHTYLPRAGEGPSAREEPMVEGQTLR